MEQTPGQQDPEASGSPAADGTPAGEPGGAVPPFGGGAPPVGGPMPPPGGYTPPYGGPMPPPGGYTPPYGGPMPPPGGYTPPYGGPMPPPGGTPPPRRLYRLRNNRMLAGVGSGLGAYFEVDPIWVRLAFVALTIFGGAGILLYLVCWVVMPAVDFAPPMGTMQPPARRLYRLRNDRVIAGVASGLGAHLDVDPIWIRLAFVVLAFAGGLGVILYFVGCVAMPSVDSIPPTGGAAPLYRGRRSGTDLRIVAGAVFLIVAAFVFAGSFHFHDTGLIWGAALIGIGLLFLVGDQWPSRYPAGPLMPPADFVPPAGYTTRAAGAGDVPPVSSPVPPYVPPVYSSYSSYTPYAPQPAYAAPAYGAQAGWPGSASRPGGLRLGTVGLAAVVLAVGVALLLQSVGVIHLTAEMGFGIVLLVLGLTLVVGARFGRSGGLVALGICLLPFAAAAVLVPEPLTGGVGNVSYTPQALSAVQSTYRLAAGQLYVDLSGVDLGGRSVAVTSSVGFGHLVVVVPAGTTVELSGKVGAGEDNLLGRIDSGVQISSQFDAATGPASAGTLTLDVSVGCGQLTVETGNVDVQTRSVAGGSPVVVTSTAGSRRAGAR
jgi:phage shock protein PspC (stress-responsive transcriptional regulator)